MKYDLNQCVKLIETEECGTIRGRAEYANCESTHLVRYRAADGKQTTEWFNESDLEPK